MHAFTDSAGREWNIALNINAIRRIRDGVKTRDGSTVDLLAPQLAEVIRSLTLDTISLCDCVYLAVQPEAEKRGISSEQFGEALCGDAIADATQAFLGALTDFTPSPRDRARVARVMKALDETVNLAHDEADAKVDQLISGLKSGALPDTSDTAPAQSAT